MNVNLRQPLKTMVKTEKSDKKDEKTSNKKIKRRK